MAAFPGGLPSRKAGRRHHDLPAAGPFLFWPHLFLAITRNALSTHACVSQSHLPRSACDDRSAHRSVSSIANLPQNGLPQNGPARMAVPRGGEDTLWAVIATVGKTDRIADIYRTRDDALNDRAWRTAQVRAYEHLIVRTRQPVPRYSVVQIRRADIPRAWSPLPALGFLRGRFV